MSNTMNKKQLGEMVDYTHVPIRAKNGNSRKWHKTQREGTAMYIGYRYIYDGYMEWDMEWDYGIDGDSEYFVQESSHKVWLVVKNDRTNPFYVYPMEEE